MNCDMEKRSIKLFFFWRGGLQMFEKILPVFSTQTISLTVASVFSLLFLILMTASQPQGLIQC